MDFSVTVDRTQIIGKYLDLAEEMEMLCNISVAVIPIRVGILGIVSGRIGNQRKNQNHTDHSIVEIS